MQHVSSIATNENGVVRVEIQGINDDVDDEFIYMVPMHSSTVQKTAATAGHLGSNFHSWLCGASNSDVVQVLPGSCSIAFGTTGNPATPTGTFSDGS